MGRLLPHDKELAWTPYAWLIYVVPFAMTPLMASRFRTPWGWTLYAVATLFFIALYFRAYWVRGRELLLVAAATLLLGIGFWPVSLGAGAFFIYAASMIAQHESPRRAIFGVALITLITIAEALVLHMRIENASWPIVFTIIVGAINIHFSQVGRSNARLRLAQDEIEHLAKVAERERIARDLHDLLGHTLSLVVLKSELATKLADRDPERAREEIRDVERIAREALAEVRAAVTGYRSGGLQAELQHARNALATAGVALETEIAKAALPPSHEAVLCLALREAVTNIVRHAGARVCRVALSVTDANCALTIADDGRGGNAPFGSGLSGMRERVEVLGGSLRRDGRHGTTLTVILPLNIAGAAQERSA
ncbi:MAG TPA: sensor histidine kinase [Thermoanaerobaculia bacterium]|nr:sensor histidine kinase [Thermoanaerobaculia bacterium]